MICLVPNGAYLSEVSRMVAIWHALRARGIVARVALHGGTHAPVLQREGIPHDLLAPEMDAARCAAFVADNAGMAGGSGQPMRCDELVEHARHERAYFERHGVRVVVTGFATSTLLSAPLAGARLVTEHAGSFIPPLFERGLAPAPSRPLGKAWGWLPAALARRLANRLVFSARSSVAEINRAAAVLGAPPVPSTPALLLGDVTLVPELPQVLGLSEEDLRAWRPRHPDAFRPQPRLCGIGPLYARLDVPLPPRAEAFLRAPGSVVYVAPTSMTAAAVEAVTRRVAVAGHRVLLASTVHDLRHLESSQVLVEGVLPSHEAMPLATAAVIAGGQGSIQCAQASGIPFVALPLHWEQDINAHLAARTGASLTVAAHRADSPALTAAVRNVVADPAYRAAARRVQALYAARDGASDAASVLAGMLAVS